ncbi:MAG TPA: bifunctional adenosylcobinamide kinase/adenosylcobinamide-phosphate guanylyltransferase [Acidimicrobiia bacterium]|nr:bifunctional adenosylcobinamide kinase/adenosylcobinamide-phosphate guanylyltransferase [Acidimicrobiia bacterium]
MALTLLLGGARSGKSRLAEGLTGPGAGTVTLIATAEGRDDEMRDRILQHQRSRPDHWRVLEEPIELEAALESVDDATPVVVDCLTLWVSNLVELGLGDDEIQARASRAAAVAGARRPTTIVVSNEVGSGIVPLNELARRYRDLLGRVNALWADAADRVLLAVAGGVVPVMPARSLWETADD